jgi:lipopolysaccharide transport system permease protein
VGASRDIPVMCIRPKEGWIALDFGEMWRLRDLLYFLAWRDVKVKYKQALLGFAWAVLVPFANMVVFGLVFGKVAKLPSDGLNPFLFYFAALVPWQYFATSLSMSANSLVGQAELLTKIYLPRLFIPLSPCLAGLVDFAIAFLILVGMMLCMQIVPAVTILFVPLLMLIAVATALGAGLTLAALNVKYRDIRYVMPFVIQMWMYLSVLLPFSTVVEKLGEKWGNWCYLYALNPMVGVIEGVRWCLLHAEMIAPAAQGKGTVPLPWDVIALGLPGTGVLLLFGLYYFKRMERQFADVV